jgi:hypothetical protein
MEETSENLKMLSAYAAKHVAYGKKKKQQVDKLQADYDHLKSEHDGRCKCCVHTGCRALIS